LYSTFVPQSPPSPARGSSTVSRLDRSDAKLGEPREPSGRAYPSASNPSGASALSLQRDDATRR
jgi:hypothetical protein